MKKNLLVVILFFAGKNIYSQVVSLGNNEINIEIKHSVVSKDTFLIVIKNLTQKTALISMIDGVNTNEKYLGIGLYSSVFPYSPDHLSKYNGKLELTAISPTDSLVIKRKSTTKLFEDLVFNLDYILQDLGVGKNDFAMVDRTVYDKNVCFLKLKINN